MTKNSRRGYHDERGSSSSTAAGARANETRDAASGARANETRDAASGARANETRDAAAGARAALQEKLLPQGNGHTKRKSWFPPSFCSHPLSAQAAIVFLKKTADTAATALLTLSTFFATYLLAWGKGGSSCIPDPKITSELGWVQLFVASLPFALFPITLYVNGLAHAVGQDGYAWLGVLSTLCLIECLTAFTLGGGMLYCATGSRWVWSFTLVMAVLMLVTWALTFEHPKGLRKFVWSTCLRQPGTVAVADEQRQPGTVAAVAGQVQSAIVTQQSQQDQVVVPVDH